MNKIKKSQMATKPLVERVSEFAQKKPTRPSMILHAATADHCSRYHPYAQTGSCACSDKTHPGTP